MHRTGGAVLRRSWAAGLFWASAAWAQTPSASQWTIYVANTNCPDYTWVLDERNTRVAIAELVRAHLDEMRRTDPLPPESRSRYNMVAAQEAALFLERYPQRRQELIRRVKEGRLFVSPFLNNSMWGFQSLEAVIRSLYSARRLEREWGVKMDAAAHIEEPSLPWGMASILSGAGIRWLAVAFYDYDSTFKGLTNPPYFTFEGPDGGRIRVVMDRWASLRANYQQGARLLRDARVLPVTLLPKKAQAEYVQAKTPDLERIEREWIAAYARLDNFPLKAFLADGTHGDIAVTSAEQARPFAEAIIAFNQGVGGPKLVNAALPQFFAVVDEAERRKPFLATLRGCFGHSWDVWPVSLARYVAQTRTGETQYLSAEALLALAAHSRPEVLKAVRAQMERAAWVWMMLGDHAWNGSSEANKKENARLRRQWSEELVRLGGELEQRAWTALGLESAEGAVTLFNSLSFPRRELVALEVPAQIAGVGGAPAQRVEEEGRTMLYFVPPPVAPFGFETLRLTEQAAGASTEGVRGAAWELEGPYYKVRVDRTTGGLASVFHKAAGRELVQPGAGRSVGQTLYWDGQERPLSHVQSELAAAGPVLGRLRITGRIGEMLVTTLVTAYAELDRLDFDVRVRKPPGSSQERLTHVFPIASPGAVERIETPGAVVRPYLWPAGDLLDGADQRRFAVQGFVDVSLPAGPGVTIAPLEAYVLRRDLGPVTFEALGNDQNYREVVRDQDGVSEFRFRYALRAHAAGYEGPAAFIWSRSVKTPLLVGRGQGRDRRLPVVQVDPQRAVATCLKPADERGFILRLWETAGKTGPVTLGVSGYRQAVRTDLLERDLERLALTGGRVTVSLPAHGFAAVRLLP